MVLYKLTKKSSEQSGHNLREICRELFLLGICLDLQRNRLYLKSQAQRRGGLRGVELAGNHRGIGL
jgi:hypothetical protein